MIWKVIRGDDVDLHSGEVLRLLVRGVGGNLSIGIVPYIYSNSSDDKLPVSSSFPPSYTLCPGLMCHEYFS